MSKPIIEVTGIDELIQRIDDIPAKIKKSNRTALTATGLFLKGQVEERWAVDTGFSRDRIEFEIDEGKSVTDLNVGFLDRQVDYAYFVENGRKPGAFPPLQSIVEWLGGKKSLQKEMIASFYPDKKTVPLIQRQSKYDALTSHQKGMVFIIGRSVAKNGTKGVGAFKEVRAKKLSEAERVYFDKLLSNLNL